jgi:hypothetical protein
MTARTGIGFIAIALLLSSAGQALAQRQAVQRQAQVQQGPEWDKIFRSVLPQTAAPVQTTQKRQRNRQTTQRAPTRIIVRPVLRNRHDATEFPRSDNLGYPGRNAVRECRSWLATEHRPSGTVVTPQMRCWWQPG